MRTRHGGDDGRQAAREVERRMDGLAEERKRTRAARLQVEGEIELRRARALEYLSLNPQNHHMEDSLGVLSMAGDEAEAAYDALEAGQAREASRLEGALADVRRRRALSGEHNRAVAL